MRKWHLFKEYFLFDNGNQKNLEYMALFCTNEDGSYHKHIDIVYNNTIFDVIDDIVDNSYFLFDYDLKSPEVQKIHNEKNLIEKIKMIESEDKILPAEAIRQKHIIEFHPDATAGDIFISKFEDKETIISLCANKSLFHCDNIDIENDTYKYKDVSLIFYEQVELEILYEYISSFYNLNLKYDDLLKYENITNIVHFNAVAKLMITLIQYKQLKLSFGNENNIIAIPTHFDNIRSNFFEVGSQLSKYELEICLKQYFDENTSGMINQILEYRENKELYKDNKFVEFYEYIDKHAKRVDTSLSF